MHSSQLASMIAQAAEEKTPPIIDFDGTVVLQFLLFLAMYFVLKYLVFLPYLRLREKRFLATQGNQQEAEHILTEARLFESQYNQTLAHVRNEVEAERTRLYLKRQNESQTYLHQAQNEMQTRIENANLQIVKQAEEARQKLKVEVDSLGQAIATKILGREIPE